MTIRGCGGAAKWVRWRALADARSAATIMESSSLLGPAGPERSLSWARRFLSRAIDLALRGHSTPLQVGAGVALGTLIGLTPLYGLHVLMALALAAALRINIAGAALATQISNPLFAPFLIVASVRLGNWMGVGEGGVSFGAGVSLLIWAWLAGGLALGVALGLLLGVLAGLARSVALSRHRAPGAGGGR